MAYKQRKRKVKKNIPEGIAHIHATFNNTIVTLSDKEGNAIAWSSAGALGFKGSKKSTPFAAGLSSEAAGKKAYDLGMRKVEVFVNDTLVDTHNGSYDVEDETIYYQTMNTVAVSNTTNGKIGTVGSDRIKDTITFNGYPTDTSIVFVSTLRDVTASTDVQTINTTVTSTGIATQTQDVLFDVFTPVAGHTYSVKTVAKVTGCEDMGHNGK